MIVPAASQRAAAPASAADAPAPFGEIFGGSARIFAAESLILPVGLIVTAILTRTLGPSMYGWFALCASVVTWVEWGITAVFTRASLLCIAEAEDWRPVAATLVRLRIAAGIAGALVLAALAGPLCRLLGEPGLAPYLRLFSIDVPIFCAAQAHNNVLVATGAFRGRAWMSAARWLSRLLLVALAAALGFSLAGAIIASMGASVAELATGRLFVRPAIFRPSGFPAAQLWRQAMPLTLFALCMRLFDKMDLFFLTALGAPREQTGFYGGAQNLSVVPTLITVALSPLLLAVITRLARQGLEKQAREVVTQILRGLVALIPFAALAAAASPDLTRLILGPRFGAAADPFALLIFASLSLVVVSTGTAILTAAGKAVWTVYLALPIVPAAAAGHLMLIPRLGMEGAALVTLGASLGVAVATVIAVCRQWQIELPLGTLWRGVGLGIAIYALMSAWPSAGLLVTLKLAAGCLLIPAGFWLLGEFTASELHAMRARVRGAQPAFD